MHNLHGGDAPMREYNGTNIRITLDLGAGDYLILRREFLETGEKFVQRYTPEDWERADQDFDILEAVWRDDDA